MTDKQKIELIKELIDTTSVIWDYDNKEAQLVTMDVVSNFITKICDWNE